MSNYQGKQSFQTNKFELDIYPYVASPENRFEKGSAVQYGADFKVRFRRGGSPKEKIGLIQLILPRTALFTHTTVGGWNVDRRELGDDLITLSKCLYGDEGVKIGAHSSYYKGSVMRSHSEAECWLIDTPREISSRFDNKSGFFEGFTNTKFADYVVELKGKTGTIFNQGVVWGYSVVQNAVKPAEFSMTIVPPTESLLTESKEHRNAIAAFLRTDVDFINKCISK